MARCNLYLYILFFILLAYHNTDALENCTAIDLVDTALFKVMKFSKEVSQETVGFSVDLIFSGPVKNFEVNDPAKVTKISANHFVISVAKLQRTQVKKAEFTANYTELDADVKLVGVILNGDQVLCGEGVTKVVAPSQFQTEDTKECKPSKIVGWEDSSQMTIREKFVSNRIGLAIDIIFESDVDTIECNKFFLKKYSNRHYMLFNSGYITSKDRDVQVVFEVFHKQKPLPSLLAIVMNDVAVCGFSTSREVFNYESFDSVSKLLEEEDENLLSFANLMNSSIIISVFAFISVLASGVAVWKLSSPFTSAQQTSKQPIIESIYSEPAYIRAE